MKSAVFACLPLLTLFACAPFAHADTLKGSSVKGVLSIDGSRGNDFSPAKTTVGPGLEYNAVDVGSDTCEYTANLSAKKIVVTDKCSTTITDEAAARVDAKPPFTMSFTDPALTGDAVTAINNALGLTFSLTGDTLNFTFDGTDQTGSRSSFAVATAVTPEPASWQLLALGLAGMAAIAGTTKLRSVA